MQISRLHRKLFLLIDQRYALWQDRQFERPAEVAAHLGVNKGTYSNWRNGRRISKNKLKELCLNLSNEAKKIPDSPLGKMSPIELFLLLQDDDIGVVDFAARFKITEIQCRQIVDEWIHERVPLFRSFCFGEDHSHNHRAANEIVFPLYCGRYAMFRVRRANKNEIRLICSLLDVRYVMRVSDHPDLWAIRCKLVVPSNSIRQNNQIYEYDGFLCEKRRFVHWVFEQRGGRDASDDFIFIITDRKAEKEDVIFGKCLTTSGHLGKQKLITESVYIEPITSSIASFFKPNGDNLSSVMLPRTYSADEWAVSDKLKEYVNKLSHYEEDAD